MAQNRAMPVATPMTARRAGIGGALAGSGWGAGLALAAPMERAAREPPSPAAGGASAFGGGAIVAEPVR
jgi:hypothetical protein